MDEGKAAGPSRSGLASMTPRPGKVSEVNNGIKRLAEAVAERRKQLNLTLDHLNARGGPSDVTTSKVEKAELQDPSARTLRRLDVGLQWVEGSAARVVAGGDPVSLEDLPATRRSIPSAVTGGENSVTVPLAVVNDLSDVAKRYERLADSAADAALTGELRQINETFDLLVDRIMRGWLIAQLERKSDKQSTDPVTEMLIGDYLNRTPTPATFEDSTELNYLRWLTGRAGDLDSATENAFISQWQSGQEKIRSDEAPCTHSRAKT